MESCVIYLFTSPSGRAYAGRHTCDPEGWPRRGSGPLPSGYRGSGLLWANVTKKHGPAIRWAILRRFPADTPRATVDEAERRAIRLVRAIWGERCMNVRDGGQGLTSEEAQELARAQWEDASFRDRHRKSMVETYSDTERREGLSTMLRDCWSDPGYRDAQCEALRIAGSRPEVRAKRSAAGKAYALTPEGAAHITRMAVLNSTPEATAKKVRTRRINDSWRRWAEANPHLLDGPTP